MKILIRIIIAVIVTLIVIFFAVYLHEKKSNKQQKKSAYNLNVEEIKLIEDGDIILRHGYGTISDIIAKTLNEKYDISHCAVLVKDTKNINVIHTVSQTLSDFDGLQQQTLSRFIADSKPNSIIIVRYKGNKNQIISEKAKYYLALKVPFDHDFDINDTSKFYCNEFVLKLIKDVYNKDLLDNTCKSVDNKSQYKFNVFWDTTNFKIILNHHLK
jgi:hypothetical protein